MYSTVQGYFYAWSRNGTFASLNHALVMAAREAAEGDDVAREVIDRGVGLRRARTLQMMLLFTACPEEAL